MRETGIQQRNAFALFHGKFLIIDIYQKICLVRLLRTSFERSFKIPQAPGILFDQLKGLTLLPQQTVPAYAVSKGYRYFCAGTSGRRSNTPKSMNPKSAKSVTKLPSLLIQPSFFQHNVVYEFHPLLNFFSFLSRFIITIITANTPSIFGPHKKVGCAATG